MLLFLNVKGIVKLLQFQHHEGRKLNNADFYIVGLAIQSGAPSSTKE